MAAVANLVHETSTSTGTGNLTLANVNGKNNFSDAFGTGGSDVFEYFISNRSAAEWERGTGSMSDSTTLVRDTVLESTNSDAAVNFSAGTKDVTNDIPAGDQITRSSVGQVLLESGTVSSQATLDIVLTSYTSYRGIIIKADLSAATDNVSLRLRLSTNGGSSYDSGASDYKYSGHLGFTTGSNHVVSGGASSIIIAGDSTNGVGNVSDEGVHSTIEILSQTNTAKKPKVFYQCSWIYFDNGIGTMYGSAFRNAAQDTDAVQLFFSSGNISSGSYAIYGLT